MTRTINQSKCSKWRDSSRDSKLPKSAAVLSQSSFHQKRVFPKLQNFWRKNKEKQSTLRTEPTETPSSKHKSQPEKDSNCIKELLRMDLFCSVVELWTKTQLLKRNLFVTLSLSSLSTSRFTRASLSFIWKTWRSNSWLLNLHLDLLSWMVQEHFTPHCKEMRSKFLTSSQLSYPRSTTKGVNHQSDSPVSDNKNVTTIWERFVKLLLKHSSPITSVMSLDLC